MEIRDLTADDLADIASWSYDGPWSVYDSTGPLDPAMGYWAVADGDRLVGFACLGADARVPGLAEADGVLDVGVGLRPDLVGQGLGPAFAEVVLAFAAARGRPRLRAVVQDWNARSLRLLERLGFARTATHPVGDVTYVVLERTVTDAPDGPRAVAVVQRDHKVLLIKRHYDGRDYAVLPGGSVEPGETFEEAVVRELWEETTLRARVDGLLLAGEHNGREARYFVMADVAGTARLSGPELEAHAPDNSFELVWAAAPDLRRLALHPAHLQVDLPRLLDLS